MTKRSASKRAASALSSIAPSDVEAHAALWQSDPARSIALRDAVIAACARPVAGVDMGAVAGHAVMIVARQAARLSNDGHAVSTAVRLARQAVTAAAAGETVAPMPTEDGAALLLTRGAMGTDPAAIAAGPATLASDCLDSLPGSVRDVFGRIAAAWLAHVPAACGQCDEIRQGRPGGRPLTLARIRAHVAGLPVAGGAGRRLYRGDLAIVRAVTDALAPVIASAPYEAPTGAWAEAAARAVVRGPGEWLPDSPVRARWDAPVVRQSRAVESREILPGPVVEIPGDRLAAVEARQAAAWDAAEARRVAGIRARQTADAAGQRAAVEWRPAGESAPDPWGRVVPVPGGRVTVTEGAPAPMWTGGPIAGPAPLPAPLDVTTGRIRGERVTRFAARTGETRAEGPARLVMTRRLPAPPIGEPDGMVTVRRADGSEIRRHMTEAELGALDRSPESVEIAGEILPVVRGEWPGEREAFGDSRRGGTAPAPAGDRVAGEPDGMVRAFAVAPSPRKRPGGIGPVIPAGPGTGR